MLFFLFFFFCLFSCLQSSEVNPVMIPEQCSKNKTLRESQYIAFDAKHMSSCQKRKKKEKGRGKWVLPSVSCRAIVQQYRQLSLLSVMFFFSVLATGLQAMLPEYLRARFVQAALSYIGCNEEGQFVCQNNDCWCQCAVDYPQCNCPESDLRAIEASLQKIQDSWKLANQDFEESGQCFCFCSNSITVTLPWTTHYILLLEENKKRKQGSNSMQSM